LAEKRLLLISPVSRTIIIDVAGEIVFGSSDKNGTLFSLYKETQ
jgi:hypothetical protein